ncbi:MAG: hypothetical protein CM15mP103_06130 [Gammaproteobacteria bacterium]|nr:MAG: hypothetical protein CM15mP103_06130 [Gammaproteobacteria bacterium]
MRFLMVLCLVVDGPSAFAEEEAMRDVKTANPFILLHPESQQAALRRITPRWRKCVQWRDSAQHAQLAAISASVAMKCVYCIPAHTAFARAAAPRRRRSNRRGNCGRRGAEQLHALRQSIRYGNLYENV